MSGHVSITGSGARGGVADTLFQKVTFNPRTVLMKLDTLALQVIPALPIRDKTRATYLSTYRCHIAGPLGKLAIDAITRSDIKGMLIGLPPQTAMMTLAVVKVLFREALENGVVEKSPVHGIRGPKVMVQPRKFLTWDELDAIHFGKYTKQIRFLALHGLRWSEAVVLTSDDIRDGKVFITKSIHGATKSRAGMRVIPLVSEFVPFPRHPRTLRRVLKPYGITIHSLRHTYAYILKRQGIHVTTAQKLLGHSDPKVTLAVYTQVLDMEIEEAGDILKLMVSRAHSSEMRRHLPARLPRSA